MKRKFLLTILPILILTGCNSSSKNEITQAQNVPTIVINESSSISSSTVSAEEINTISIEKESSLSENRVATLSDSVNPDRTIYKTDFFFEPLSDSVKTRIYGLSYKTDCTVPYEDLRYLNVLYCDFNGETQIGELICNKSIAQDLVEIFYELYQANYPIEKIKLIDEYQADDDLSCLDNNTSCFNYRTVSGSTKLSKHALGRAIDINPFYNPYVTYPGGIEKISPIESTAYADRNADFIAKIDESDLCYQLFIAHGFTWGGSWNTLKDYQHFQK
jgi:hypothetical protein